MITYAARYGHQRLPDIGDMTPGELGHFNDALSFWITKENAPGEGL